MQQPTFGKYAHYQAEDFLQDAYFQHWVLSEDRGAEAFWKTFMLCCPHQKDRVEEVQNLAEGIRYKPHVLSGDKQDVIFRQVYAASQSRESPSAIYQKRNMAAAASTALLLASVLLWLFNPTQETYQTGYQETRTVKLSDGSEVTLNANTLIRVVIDNGKNRPRQVWLQGEAYFHVNKLDHTQTNVNPEPKKFIVHTDNFDIEVLGNIFNADSRTSTSEVYLEKDKVQVASEKIARSQIPEPGDQLALTEENEAFRVKKVAKAEASAWQERFFVFKNTLLKKGSA